MPGVFLIVISFSLFARKRNTIVVEALDTRANTCIKFELTKDINEEFFLEKLRVALIPKLVGVTSRIAKPKILFPFLNVQVITEDG